MAKKAKLNRYVDALLTSAVWHVDLDWGLQQLSSYVADAELASSSSLADLYAARRKQAAMIRLYEINRPGILAMEFRADEGSMGESDEPKQYIAHYTLSGPMRLQGGACSWGVNDLAHSMEYMDGNESIVGHFLEMDTGGGESLSGDVLYATIKGLNKPVKAHVHRAGSAGMHAIAGATQINMSCDSAEAGSIGTFYSINKQIAKWYAENVDDIYSTKSPDKNAAFRAYLKGDKSLLVKDADAHVDKFHRHIAASRSLPIETAESTLKGGMFEADEAIARGLADTKAPFAQSLNDFNHFIQNNTSDMDFKQLYGKVSTQLARIFGWQSTEVEGEALATKLEAMKPISEQIDDAVASRLGAITAQLTALEAKVGQTSTSASEDLTALNARITELQTQATAAEATRKAEQAAWAAEKVSLEAQVAELSGKPPTTGNSTGSRDTVGRFSKTLNSLELDGESKY